MHDEHGKEYGDGVPWAESGEGSKYFLAEMGLLPSDVKPSSLIIVYAKVNIYILINIMISVASSYHNSSGTMSMEKVNSLVTLKQSGLRRSGKLWVERRR